MAKLVLVLLSLAIMFIGVMNSGDPSGFYSSSSVFYAMLLLEYYGQQEKFNHNFLKVARGFMMFMAAISSLGVFGMFSLKSVGEKYYICFQESMKISDKGIINVQWVFSFMAIAAIITSMLELIFKIDHDNTVSTGQKTVRKKGA